MWQSRIQLPFQQFLLPNWDAIWTLSITTMWSRADLLFVSKLMSIIGMPLDPPVRSWGDANRITDSVHCEVWKLFMVDRSVAHSWIDDHFMSSRCRRETQSKWLVVTFWSFQVWSDARARRGDINNVIPFITYSATWYTRDLTPLVGLTTSTWLVLFERWDCTKSWIIPIVCHSWGCKWNNLWVAEMICIFRLFGEGALDDMILMLLLCCCLCCEFWFGLGITYVWFV